MTVLWKAWFRRQPTRQRQENPPASQISRRFTHRSDSYSYRGWPVLMLRADQMETFEEVTDALIRVDADLANLASDIEHGWQEHLGVTVVKHPDRAEREALRRARDLSVEQFEDARAAYQSVLNKIAVTEPVDREALLAPLAERKQQMETAKGKMAWERGSYELVSETLEDDLWAQQRLREMRVALLERLQSLSGTASAAAPVTASV